MKIGQLVQIGDPQDTTISGWLLFPNGGYNWRPSIGTITPGSFGIILAKPTKARLQHIIVEDGRIGFVAVGSLKKIP